MCLLLKNGVEIPTSGAMDKVTRERSIFSFRANGQLINSFELIDKEDVIHIQYLDDNGHILVFYKNSQVRIYTQRGVMIKDFKLAQNLATQTQVLRFSVYKNSIYCCFTDGTGIYVDKIKS